MMERDERPAPLSPPRGGLRAKGALGLLALLAYVAGMCAMVVFQRAGMLRAFDEIAALHATEQQLSTVRLGLSRLDAELAGGHRGAGEMRNFQERAQDLVADVAPADPETRTRMLHLRAAFEAYAAVPSDANLGQLRARMSELVSALGQAAQRVAGQVKARAAAFRDQSLVSTASLIVIGGLGLALLAVVVVFFFGRMTADLRRLACRTVELVDGAARRPVPISRFDEVGHLAAAINQLAVALDHRERDLELERRKAFHHEKMAAVGSLAAGVLTEIGNPIAAIDGYARALQDAGARWELPGGAAGPEVFLEQTARLTVIAHEIAELAAPQPSQRLLVDVNGVVEKAVGMLRFEEAMQGIAVELDLDRQLPAIAGRTDRLVQLMMNLIGNAADAVRERARHGARIAIATRREGRAVVLEVVDNGAGMTEALCERAFEPFFTTKPAGRGTGLGLPLCKSIVEEHEGTIGISSQPGRGTRVRVELALAVHEEACAVAA